MAAGLRFLEFGFKVLHIGIGITETLGLAETHAVNDGSVVEGIRDDCILRAEKGLEHAAVCIEAGCVEDGVLCLEILRHDLFKFLVDVLGAADEAHGRHTVAAAFHCLFGGLGQAGVVGQAKVVVGAEVERLAAVLERYFRALGACYIPFILVKSCIFDGLKLILKVFLKFSVHNK